MYWILERPQKGISLYINVYVPRRQERNTLAWIRDSGQYLAACIWALQCEHMMNKKWAPKLDARCHILNQLHIRMAEELARAIYFCSESRYCNNCNSLYVNSTNLLWIHVVVGGCLSFPAYVLPIYKAFESGDQASRNLQLCPRTASNEVGLLSILCKWQSARAGETTSARSYWTHPMEEIWMQPGMTLQQPCSPCTRWEGLQLLLTVVLKVLF